jgi:hypothetical protein
MEGELTSVAIGDWRALHAFTQQIDVVFLEQLAHGRRDVHPEVAIVRPHLTELTRLSMRTVVAYYVTAISTPEVHP